jgi:hypothetical protein
VAATKAGTCLSKVGLRPSKVVAYLGLPLRVHDVLNGFGNMFQFDHFF